MKKIATTIAALLALSLLVGCKAEETGVKANTEQQNAKRDQARPEGQQKNTQEQAQKPMGEPPKSGEAGK